MLPPATRHFDGLGSRGDGKSRDGGSKRGLEVRFQSSKVSQTIEKSQRDSKHKGRSGNHKPKDFNRRLKHLFGSIYVQQPWQPLGEVNGPSKNSRLPKFKPIFLGLAVSFFFSTLVCVSESRIFDETISKSRFFEWQICLGVFSFLALCLLLLIACVYKQWCYDSIT